MAEVRCGNCQWQGDEEAVERTLVQVHHLGERLDPGDEVPAGECPECGAFAYLIHAHDRRRTDKPKRKEQQLPLL